MKTQFPKKLARAAALILVLGGGTALAAAAEPMAAGLGDLTGAKPGGPSDKYSECHYECAPLAGGGIDGEDSYDQCMQACLAGANFR